MWLALFIKEWQDSLPRFMLVMIVNSIGFLGMWIAIERGSLFFVLIAVALIVIHIIYLFFEWIIAFSREWRSNTHVQWLNLPVSGWVLLTSKMGAGLSQFLLSLIYAMAVAYVILGRMLHHAQRADSLFTGMADVLEPLSLAFAEFSPYIVIGITHAAASIGLAAVFIYLMAKSFRPFGWILAIVIVFGVNWLIDLIGEQSWYQALEQTVPLIRSDDVVERLLELFGEADSVMISNTGGDALYLGHIVMAFIGYAVVLFVCKWLIDRFVEA
ncbi:hypothetical protein [Salisediminibacterium selenitireducens]|uniref:Uncharacterized protein n=1 Tax=Bacillus selenitireducens (strain ATCC 700615 / DSM 15326 / MLS10) TaxID=439292 RepID=D6XUB3_BACIE|nr:hypothetical protein [Salisediminibacterium selenitireducens]ADH99399.1 hypothetical protein Bsel_1895 [[Bacillus] selenitireducens MLS10]